MADAQELMLMAYRESWGDIVDPRDGPYFDDISSGYQRQQHATMRRDRSDGRFLPVYDNEVDLAIIRAMARLMHERVPMAKARTKRLTDYTISRGFDWTVTHEDKELGKELALIVKRFFDDNKFTVILERESYEAECVDGEWLAELAVDDGQICLNLMVSDNLVEPSNTAQLDEWLNVDFVSSWSFGVLSKLYYPNRPKGYHIVRDIGGTDWDFIPESRFLHWKKNTPELAKRGFGDAYTTHVYLGRADKVLANTAEGAAVQAAIAYICEHVQGTSSQQAQNVVANLLNRTTRDPVTGSVIRSKKIAPGQRVDIPAGMKYHAGLFGSNNSQIYIQVMESLIRLSGIVDAMPEHFLTGSAENNNMASSLVAESPFVQGRLAEQTLRKQRLKCLIEKVLRLACKVGLVKGVTWDEVERGLKVTIQEPSIVTRDPVALTQALTGQMEAGLTSKRTASQELGRDYEEEQANIEKEKPPEPPPGMPGAPVPPGTPGAQPGAQPGQAPGTPNPATGAQKPPVPAQPAAGAKVPMGESVKDGVGSLSVAHGIKTLGELLRLTESATGVVVAADGARILERDLALYAYANQGSEDVASLPPEYQAWFYLPDRLTEDKSAGSAVKDGDGDGLINDGKSNEGPAPVKQPLLKSKPGTHKGAGSSGVDTTAWSMESKSGAWAIKKVHAMELAAANGDWDAVAAAFTKSDKTKEMNSYQKGVYKAQQALLAKKADAIEAPAVTPGQWTKIGGQLGSQVGGTYTGPDGKKYYVKTPSDPERAKSEALAFRLYHATGAGAVNSTLAVVDGKLGSATEWMESDKVDWNNPAMRAKAAEDFAVHAWLANWDCIGHVSEMDNVRLDKTGKLRLVDAGGSLDQKATGGTKPFGDKVAEWDSLRNPKLNPSAAKVFGQMTPEQLATSVKKLDNVSDADIKAMVAQMGPSGDANAKLAETLIARKKDLQAKAKAIMAGKGVILEPTPVAPAPAAPAPAPSTPTPVAPANVDPLAADLDAMINGPSMPMPLPKPAKLQLAPDNKNYGYQKHFDAIEAAAAAGDVEAVKAYKTKADAKQTYAKKLHAYKMQVLASMGSSPEPSVAAPTTAPAPAASKVKAFIMPEKFPAKPELQTSNVAHKTANEAFMQKALDAATAGDVDALNAMNSPSPKVSAWHQQLKSSLEKQLQVPQPPGFGKPPVGVSAVLMDDAYKAAVEGNFLKLSKLKLGIDYSSATPQAKEYVDKAMQHAADVVKKSASTSPAAPVATPSVPSPKSTVAPEPTLIEQYKKLGEVIPKKVPKSAPKVGYWAIVGTANVPETAMQSYKDPPAEFWKTGMDKWSSLSSSDQTAVRDYTGSSYGPMNSSLRNPPPNAKARRAVAALNSIAVPLPVGQTLSRKHDGDMSSLKPGVVVADAGILSTSTDKNVWSGQNHWSLTVGEGVKGLPAKSFSKHKSEDEVLFAPNTRIMVTSIEPRYAYNGKQNGHIVHAIILPHEG